MKKIELLKSEYHIAKGEKFTKIIGLTKNYKKTLRTDVFERDYVVVDGKAKGKK